MITDSGLIRRLREYQSDDTTVLSLLQEAAERIEDLEKDVACDEQRVFNLMDELREVDKDNDRLLAALKHTVKALEGVCEFVE